MRALSVGKVLVCTFGAVLGVAVLVYSIVLLTHSLGWLGQGVAESVGTGAAIVILVCVLPGVAGFVVVSTISPERRWRKVCTYLPLVLIGLLAVSVLVAAAA